MAGRNLFGEEEKEAPPLRGYQREPLARADLGAVPPPPTARFRRDNALICERTRFNRDRSHRFTLFRHWGDPGNYVACIGMNPSGAQEDLIDRTVQKMCTFADAHWGFGALYMLNALSIRCTDSRQLPPLSESNCPENDRWIREIVRGAGLVVVGWGNPRHGSGRGPAVEQILREECDLGKVKCFGRTNSDAPFHPLYQPYSRPLELYFDADAH